MKPLIQKSLTDIETEFNVDILYAAESGSRVWGFDSPNSDFDVRFIYKHSASWYNSITEKRDVIERPGDPLDITGWDVRKTLRLARKFNPQLREWFGSPCVYTGSETGDRLKAIVEKHYSRRACVYHYHSMAWTNYREYLQGDTVQRKKYLYVLRPLLCVRWLMERNSFPPLNVDFLRQEILGSGMVGTALDILVQQKRLGMELATGNKIPILNNWIEEQLNSRPEVLDKDEDPLEELDEFFRETVFDA